MNKNKNRQQRVNKIATILNAFLFGLGAFNFFDQSKWLFGVLLTIVSLCNLYTLRLGEEKKQSITVGLNSLNALVAAITAYDYYTQGTQGLHLAWGLITLMYIGVVILSVIRNRVTNEVS